MSDDRRNERRDMGDPPREYRRPGPPEQNPLLSRGSAPPPIPPGGIPSGANMPRVGHPPLYRAHAPGVSGEQSPPVPTAPPPGQRMYPPVPPQGGYPPFSDPMQYGSPQAMRGNEHFPPAPVAGYEQPRVPPRLAFDIDELVGSLRLGDFLAMGGAVLFFIAKFLPFLLLKVGTALGSQSAVYNGWEASRDVFDALEIMLVVGTIVLPLIVALNVVPQLRTARGWVMIACGVLLGILTLGSFLDARRGVPLGLNVVFTPHVGFYLALVFAVVVLAGGALKTGIIPGDNVISLGGDARALSAGPRGPQPFSSQYYGAAQPPPENGGAHDPTRSDTGMMPAYPPSPIQARRADPPLPGQFPPRPLSDSTAGSPPMRRPSAPPYPPADGRAQPPPLPQPPSPPSGTRPPQRDVNNPPSNRPRRDPPPRL